MRALDAFHDAIVVGAGIGGCATAIRLARRGWRVLLIERHRGLPKHLAGELFHPPGVDQLEALGVLAALREAGAQTVEGFAVHHESGADPILLAYDEVPNGSPSGLGMHHGAVVAALREKASETPGVTLYHARVSGVVWRGDRVCGVEVREGRGESRSIYGRLVLAADGRHSRVRESMGIEAHRSFESFSVAFTLRDVPLPVNAHGNVILGLPAPVLAYPIDDGVARVLFDVQAEVGTKLSALVQRVREEYLPHAPPALRDAIIAAIDRGDVLLAPNHWISTDRCVVPGAALIGDSAGCNHPLTASGMTTALNDAAELNAALDLSDDLDEALALYQRRHYHFARAREMLARALYDSFVADRPGTLAIRDGILNYWASSARGRALTLGLLSGSASQPMVFVREYLQVARVSIASILTGRTAIRGLRQQTRAIAGVAAESVGKVGWLLDMLDHSDRGRAVADSRKVSWVLDLLSTRRLKTASRDATRATRATRTRRRA